MIAFLTALIVGVFLLNNLEKDEKTTEKYMAQITEKTYYQIYDRADGWKYSGRKQTGYWNKIYDRSFLAKPLDIEKMKKTIKSICS